MMAALARDPIARIVVVIWVGTASLYFIPGVPHDFLVRLGDRYSTLPLWPWAIAACVLGIADVRATDQRRFWLLQAFSLAALLAIEVPWALARAGNTPLWNIAAEWCYFAYYAGQLMSAARTTRGLAAAIIVTTVAAATLSVMAFSGSALYDSAWPSYLTYLAFDALMCVAFWRFRHRAGARWAPIYAGLALTSAIVFATDAIDMFSYVGMLPIESGMKTDILWTLPPLCYALVARFGRERLAAES